MAKQTLLNVYLIMISFHLVHFHDDDHEFCLANIYQMAKSTQITQTRDTVLWQTRLC